MVTKSIIKELTRNKPNSHKANHVPETIVVFGAHSDDFVIGAGGTIAKYQQEGKKILAVVFSYGEKSHPWLRPGVVQQTRSLEAFDAGKIIGVSEIVFYNLHELKFAEEYLAKNIEKDLLALLEKEKPTKLFTHSPEDLHPDHRAVHQITIDLWEKLTHSSKKNIPEVYIYSVWNPVSFQTKYPALYVPITATFSAKLQALSSFRSQKLHIAYPFLLLLFRALKEGIKIKTRFGEKFFRVK